MINAMHSPFLDAVAETACHKQVHVQGFGGAPSIMQLLLLLCVRVDLSRGSSVLYEASERQRSCN
jgi:hypothetical protein